MSRKPDVHVLTPPWPREKAEEVRTLLEQVLDSHLFRGSRRCQTLLRHITERTLAGETGSLKERTLGIEVFGRAPDYDTSQDPIVRASAAEIRKKLAQYYQEPGHESETRIELLSGSYVAEFHFTKADAPALVGEVVDPPQLGKRTRYVALAAGASTVVFLVLALALALPRWSGSDLDQLWEPVLKAPGAVLISVGQPVAYNLRSSQAQDAIQASDARHPLSEPRPGGTIRMEDLIILWDRYVALGDAVCLARVTSQLDRYRKQYSIRGERSTSFADLRENPAVLIAAFDNPWTLRTAGQLRFTFKKDSGNETDMVFDRQHPENTEWKLTGAWPNWDIPNDYAIVSRILDSTSDRPVIIAAGITEYGTMAAGEFLSNPEYFSDAARRLPRGWQKKNLQIVLRVPLVNRMPGRPRILETHVW